MQNQVLAITFTLVFLSIEAIWLIFIRNRYIILVSLVTILFGVQVLSFLIIRDHYVMGNKYFLERLGGLLLKDGFLIFALWILFYTPLFKRIKEIQLPDKISSPTNILIAFDQIFSAVKPSTKIALILISCIVGFLFTPDILFVFIPPFWPFLIYAIIRFPSDFSHSPIQSFLPSILFGDDTHAIIIGWVLYFSLVISIIFTKKSFWFILYLFFIFLLLNNVIGCQEEVKTIHM